MTALNNLRHRFAFERSIISEKVASRVVPMVVLAAAALLITPFPPMALAIETRAGASCSAPPKIVDATVTGFRPLSDLFPGTTRDPAYEAWYVDYTFSYDSFGGTGNFWSAAPPHSSSGGGPFQSWSGVRTQPAGLYSYWYLLGSTHNITITVDTDCGHAAFDLPFTLPSSSPPGSTMYDGLEERVKAAEGAAAPTPTVPTPPRTPPTPSPPAPPPAPTPPPSAKHPGPYLSGNANLRWCTNLANSFCKAPITTLPAQTDVNMVCWQDGSTATGAYKSPRWFYITSGGGEGFVHSSWVQKQSVVPNCSKVARIKATDWALAQVGSKKWDGYCLGFANLAYDGGLPGPKGSSVSAASWWSKQTASSRHTDATPPRGTIVVWGARKGYPDGHAALSLGNGWAISTWERNIYGVHRFQLSDRNPKTYNYLGWV